MTTPENAQARRHDKVNGMANGSGRMMSEEASVNIGALQQRVYGLEQAVNNISNQLSSIAQQIASGGKTNWSVLIATAGFCLLFAGAVGGLAYAPIRESQTDLKAAAIKTNEAISALANQTAFQFNQLGEKYVSIRELDGRAARTTAELSRINADLKAIDAVIVPRVEQAERVRSVDAQFVNQQRQLDDIKKQFGDTFSLRDALLQMQRRIDQLEIARRGS
jgi:regulator of sigma D